MSQSLDILCVQVFLISSCLTCYLRQLQKFFFLLLFIVVVFQVVLQKLKHQVVLQRKEKNKLFYCINSPPGATACLVLSWANSGRSLHLEACTVHSRLSQNLSQAKNQKNSSNKNRAIFQYLYMSKAYAEILRIGFPSSF